MGDVRAENGLDKVLSSPTLLGVAHADKGKVQFANMTGLVKLE